MNISIVIPVRNEEESLPRLLDALLAQTRPADEIVIADGGSTDRSLEVARRYSQRGVRVIEIGPAFPGRGRNEGIRAARNQWLALIDAGCVPERDWLEKMVERVGESAAPAVAFGQCRGRATGEWETAHSLAFGQIPDPRTGASFRVASSLMHRSCWEAIGGFPEELRAAEDLLFITRLEQKGLPIIWCPDSILWWSVPTTPYAVFRRFRLYSNHHLAAGLYRTWHLNVMLMDCGGAALAFAGWRFPIAWGVLVFAALLRLLRTVHRRRALGDDKGVFHLGRLVRVGVLLIVADAATWAGAFDFMVGRMRRI
jgi:glycosyltransferase involved in cell wall biosynthesis